MYKNLNKLTKTSVNVNNSTELLFSAIIRKLLILNANINILIVLNHTAAYVKKFDFSCLSNI